MTDFITIDAACRIIGGEEKPIHFATFYRGVRAGRYPPPVHVSPGISRVSKSKLLTALERMVQEADDAPAAA